MKQYILRALSLTVLLITGLHAYAYDFESDGLYYNILSENDRTVEVTYKYSKDGIWDSWNDAEGAIAIPQRLIYKNKTYRVTSIGNSAFYQCKTLTSVTIPNSVTSIGEDAFCSCSRITSVTIPNSVTSIGNSAFFLCKTLTSVTIPNSVTSIGNSAFHSCSGLTSVTIPNSVTSIGDKAFSECSGLTSVTIPNSVTSIGDKAFSECSGLTSVTIPNSVESIGSSAFSGCSGLTSVTIGNSVESIGDQAFYGCRGLTTMTIPNSVESIGSSAFSGCSRLTHIYVDDENSSYGSIDGILYNKDITTLIQCPQAKESVEIPNSVTSIGEEAFYSCSRLTSVTIGNSVESIGSSAFSGCSRLTSVTIGNSVTSIGDAAFYNCDNLTNIYCQAVTPPAADTKTFTTTALKYCKLYVPTGCQAAYESVDPWRNFWNIEEMDFSSIDETAVAGGKPHVSVENGVILIGNADENPLVEVYDISGKRVFSGYGNIVSGLAKGIYMVNTGANVVKVQI